MLKEDYSIMMQVHNQIASENGEFKQGLEHCVNGDNICLKNAFKNKLKKVKECEDNSSGNKCFVENNSVKNLNGSAAGTLFFNGDRTSGLMLANGSAVAFWNDSPECKNSFNGNDECGWFTIDVNGDKKPNTWGKDIYLFHIYNSTIKPCCKEGTKSMDKTPLDDCENLGYGCASKYLLNQ